MSQVTPPGVDLVKQPYQLISCGQNGCEIHLVEETLEALSQRDKPAVVISAIGLYKTGKSYLLNQLAKKSQAGFELSKKVDAQTKGIWIWIQDHPLKENHDLILLDTEGLCDPAKLSRVHDNWIYCLAILLSSAVIHNCKGAFNAANVNQMKFITEMAKHLRTKTNRESGDDFDFDAYFPMLVVTLRDFMLDLQEDGKEITADHYLENCLRLKRGNSKEVTSFNESRLAIRKYFHHRKCFTFNLPGGTRVLQNLDTIDEMKLNEEFREELKGFKDFMLETSPLKILQDGSAVNGRMLAGMLEVFVESIQKGAVPCIEEAVEKISATENKYILKEALDIFEEEIGNIIIPTSTSDMIEKKGAANKMATEYLMSRIIYDHDCTFQVELQSKVEDLYKELWEANNKAYETKCLIALKKLTHFMDEKMKAGKYEGIDGRNDFEKDLHNIEEQFNERKDLGNKKARALETFVKQNFKDVQQVGDSVEAITRRLSILMLGEDKIEKDIVQQCHQHVLDLNVTAREKKLNSGLQDVKFQNLQTTRQAIVKSLFEAELRKQAEEHEEIIKILQREHDIRMREVRSKLYQPEHPDPIKQSWLSKLKKKLGIGGSNK